MKHRSRANEVPPESNSKMTPNAGQSRQHNERRAESYQVAAPTSTSENSSTSRKFLGAGLLGGVTVELSSSENDQSENSNLVLSLKGRADHEAFRISIPSITQIHVSNGQNLNDTVILHADDAHTNSSGVYTYSLKAEIEGSNNKLAFDFKDADQATLSRDSEIIGFSYIAVKQGTLNLAPAAVSTVRDVELDAGLIMTFGQFEALSSVVSFAGRGELTILLDSDTELDQLKELLSYGGMMLIGVHFQVVNDRYESIFDAELSQMFPSVTYPSIPELSGQIDGLASALANGDYSNITAVSDALTALQSCVDSQNDALWKNLVQLNINLIETLNAATSDLETQIRNRRWRMMTSTS